MITLGVGTSTFVVALVLLIWLRFNRCLSLTGSALAGSLFVSALIDSLWAWGSEAAWFAVVVPLLLAGFAIVLIRVEDLLPTRRWVAFGLVAMFVVRALVMAPTRQDWSGRLSGNVREWLMMSRLDPSSLSRPQDLPPPRLSEIEMPCGLDRFQVKTDDLKAVSGSFQLRIEACGFSPQAFRVRGSESLEISNALGMAIQVSFALQDEGGDYAPSWSVVIPPESSIEVADFKVPVGGAVLIYAPLEPQLGVVMGANAQVPGELWVSRTPLMLKRQFSDTP
jgi:hypothetical protein